MSHNLTWCGKKMKTYGLNFHITFHSRGHSSSASIFWISWVLFMQYHKIRKTIAKHLFFWTLTQGEKRHFIYTSKYSQGSHPVLVLPHQTMRSVFAFLVATFICRTVILHVLFCLLAAYTAKLALILCQMFLPHRSPKII